MSVEKFRIYPEYRESGIEWLGRIPIEWNLWKLSHAFRGIGSGTTPPSDSSEWYGGGVPWVTTGELREREIFETKKTVTPSALKKFPTLCVHPKGSIIVAMYGATIGRLGILGIEATTNQACCVLPSSKFVDNTYLYYWFQSFRDDIVNLASGGGQPNISQAVISALRISTPSFEEQTQIAKFLDYETAKIDALIDKQQQLIALLQEKRQAVISHAVTKGLNPDAPMRDSGVEWLGEVPAHWVVAPMKRFIETRKGAPFKSTDFTDGGVPVVRASDIKNLTIQPPNVFLPTDFVQSHPRAILEPGELILSTVGSGPQVKNSAVGQIGCVPVALGGALLNQNTVVFRVVDPTLDDGFLFQLVQVSGYRDHLDLHAHGTANQASLNVADMLAFSIPLPPKKEQSGIVGYVEEISTKMRNLEERATYQVELLQERRTALISAAVTGKIDVRGWQPPASSSEGETP